MIVYIVEDEPIVGQGIRFIVENAHPEWKARLFENPGTVISAIEAEVPDVILSDIRMPGLNGLDLGEQISAKYPDIALLYLTGFADFEYAVRALRLKATDYFIKPIDPGKLVMALEKIALALHSAAGNPPVEFFHGRSIDKIIQEAKGFIDKNCEKDLTLKMIGEMFYISPTYFCEQFARQTHQTFLQYLTGVRIEKAKLLLKNRRDYTCYRIGEMVGYHNARTFNKVFRKHENMTPQAYRMRFAPPMESQPQRGEEG